MIILRCVGAKRNVIDTEDCYRIKRGLDCYEFKFVERQKYVYVYSVRNDHSILSPLVYLHY